MAKSRLPSQTEIQTEPGAPVWIISFADMSLLMLNFFIMLVAMASQRTAMDEDMLKVLASVKAGFGYVPKESSKDPLDIAVMQVLATTQHSPMRSQMRWAAPAIEGEHLRPRDYAEVKGAIGEPILFEEGSTRLSGRWETNLDPIAENVRHHYRIVVIRGHASPKEARGDPDRGFELAYRRAHAVKQALIERGVHISRLRLASSGDIETSQEEEGPLQRRAVVTLGPYFLPESEVRPESQ